MRHLKRKETGFTMVELVVAMAIIAIALLALVAALVHALALDRMTEETNLANQFAKAKAEEINAMSYGDIITYLSNSSNTAFTVPRLSAVSSDADNMVGGISYQNIGNCVEVTIGVQWQGEYGSRNQSIILRKYQ